MSVSLPTVYNWRTNTDPILPFIEWRTDATSVQQKPISLNYLEPGKNKATIIARITVIDIYLHEKLSIPLTLPRQGFLQHL